MYLSAYLTRLLFSASMIFPHHLSSHFLCSDELFIPCCWQPLLLHLPHSLSLSCLFSLSVFNAVPEETPVKIYGCCKSHVQIYTCIISLRPPPLSKKALLLSFSSSLSLTNRAGCATNSPVPWILPFTATFISGPVHSAPRGVQAVHGYHSLPKIFQASASWTAGEGSPNRACCLNAARAIGHYIPQSILKKRLFLRFHLMDWTPTPSPAFK